MTVTLTQEAGVDARARRMKHEPANTSQSRAPRAWVVALTVMLSSALAAACGSRVRPREVARSESPRAEVAPDASSEVNPSVCLASDGGSLALSESTLAICRTIRGIDDASSFGFGDPHNSRLLVEYMRLEEEVAKTPSGVERARLMSDRALLGLKLLCADFKIYEQSCRLGNGMGAGWLERLEAEVLQGCTELRTAFPAYSRQCPNR
jgi:hypothetical protein